jgi:hypothetical protein
MNAFENKILTKWVSQYVDTTVPGEIIKETVEELGQLHDEGKFTLSEESTYDFIHQIKREKGKIVECEGIEVLPSVEDSEPEDFALINEGGLCGEEDYEL